jgi:hypothetical protein
MPVGVAVDVGVAVSHGVSVGVGSADAEGSTVASADAEGAAPTSAARRALTARLKPIPTISEPSTPATVMAVRFGDRVRAVHAARIRSMTRMPAPYECTTAAGLRRSGGDARLGALPSISTVCTLAPHP